MDKDLIILEELLEVAHRLDIRVRRERLGDDEVPVRSGLAWIDHQPVLFLDSKLAPSETTQILLKELAGFPIEEIYIKPGIRALLQLFREDDATPG
ncbi:MAG: hypothetical protein PVJ01_03670 [Pseudomonadota bacterium]|jgi:hypothetical protein